VHCFKGLANGIAGPLGAVRAGLNSRPGVLAATSVLLAQWLFRRAAPGAPLAPYSFANRAIRILPGDVATTSIELLGHRALGLAAAAAVIAALALGFAFGRRPAVVFGIAAFGLTVLAAMLDPVRPSVLVSTAAAGVAALAAFGAVALLSAGSGAVDSAPWNPSRRRFIGGALVAVTFVGLGDAAAWRALTTVAPRGLVRADRSLGSSSDPRLDALPGLAPRITPTADHYVVDIDLTDPFLSAASWRLTVGGEVRSPLALSLRDLRAMSTVEQPILMQCISNRVAGSLIGNARWTGVALAEILALAGVSDEATTLVVRAADDYSETVPIGAARDGKVLLVFGMNGRLLPAQHGYPARLIFPGRYGMRSVKWVTSIEAKNDGSDGYWEKRGWDAEAFMRTGARFDTPRNGATVGRHLTAAGIAYAGDRGVGRVEVSSDDGQTWRTATLEPAQDALAWRRWMIDLELGAGETALQVRATDGAGAVQSADRTPPHPSGASGYHRIVVTTA
jgi:DMSO/TMAO reductase YedYZ molybdopterin-dependent catalytic subunit